MLNHGQCHQQSQQQHRKHTQGFLDAVGPLRPGAPDTHADGDRQQDDDTDLDDLGERRRHRLIGRHEIGQREPDDQRQAEQTQQRIDRSQGDIQRHIAAGQMRIDVGAGTARRGRQQHHAHRQFRWQLQQQTQTEADRGQQQHLHAQPDQYRFGLTQDAAEVGRMKGHAQTEHDDAERRRQQDAADQSGVDHLKCIAQFKATVMRSPSP